jgi:uncharacterized protein YukJ
MTEGPVLTSKPVFHAGSQELQYHLHFKLEVGDSIWDVAANVGTDNASDLLRYKALTNFAHPLVDAVRGKPGVTDLTGVRAAPALDFLRGNLFTGTGGWLESDVLDGSDTQDPVATLKSALTRALEEQAPVFVFGRFYTHGGQGIHDIHMNQGSRGRFVYRPGNDQNDHNDIWQDGAVMIDFGEGSVFAYFAAFTQQTVPTDDLGNPLPGGGPIA